MIKLKGIGHVNLRVADQEVSKRFYRDILGFAIAEEDPDHGGVFMTLGENFHTLDIGQHPAPDEAQRPQRGQIGLGHIAFQVGSYAALRDAYTHLVRNGVAIMRATNHVNQRSFYFADPDGNTLEIYYEMPHALQLFADGRTDQDEALPVSSADEPLPALAARRLARARDGGADRSACARSRRNARRRNNNGALFGRRCPSCSQTLSRRDAADVIRVARTAQTVKPVIKRRAEQRHHFGDKLRRVVIGLPVVVVR